MTGTGTGGDGMTAAEQVQGLRDAAAVVTGCAELGCAMHDAAGEPIGTLSPAMAKPIESILRAAAEDIERAGSCLGLPVNYALQIGGVVLGRDLGHNR